MVKKPVSQKHEKMLLKIFGGVNWQFYTVVDSYLNRQDIPTHTNECLHGSMRVLWREGCWKIVAYGCFVNIIT